MEIDRQIEAARPQASGQRQVVDQAPQPRAPRSHDDFLEVRIVDDDRLGRWFNDIAEDRVGKMLVDGANGGGGEDDVTNLPEANKKDTHRVIE